MNRSTFSPSAKSTGPIRLVCGTYVGSRCMAVDVDGAGGTEDVSITILVLCFSTGPTYPLLYGTRRGDREMFVARPHSDARSFSHFKRLTFLMKALSIVGTFPLQCVPTETNHNQDYYDRPRCHGRCSERPGRTPLWSVKNGSSHIWMQILMDLCL